jgi:hypothetical protein
VDYPADPAEPYPVVFAVPRKIDHHRLSFDIVPGDEPPKAAVLGVVPVVPHGEIAVFRDAKRSEIVPRVNVGRQDNIVDMLNVGLL